MISFSRRATLRRTISATVACSIACIGISARSAAQITVVGNTLEEHVGGAGETYSGSIQIANGGTEPAAVRIYQGDYTFSANGTSSFPDAGSLSRSNARWITPDAGVIVVPAGARNSVGYTVRIPNDSALRGTYWSVILVERVQTPYTNPDPKSRRLGIGAVMRYGIQVATYIGDSGPRNINLLEPRVLLAKDSAASMEIDVLNSGERAYRPVLTLEVYDDRGTKRAHEEISRGLLYPGASLKQRFTLGTLPAGSYKVVVFADTGDQAVFARQFRIKL